MLQVERWGKSFSHVMFLEVIEYPLKKKVLTFLSQIPLEKDFLCVLFYMFFKHEKY